jgi:co-chaperonin GroES (HSP10)
MEFEPIGSRILVRIIEQPVKQLGSIVLPDNCKDHSALTSEVVAVGPGDYEKGKFVKKHDLSVGHKVVHNHFTGVAMAINGVKHIILEPHEILGTIK